MVPVKSQEKVVSNSSDSFALKRALAALFFLFFPLFTRSHPHCHHIPFHLFLPHHLIHIPRFILIPPPRPFHSFYSFSPISSPLSILSHSVIFPHYLILSSFRPVLSFSPFSCLSSFPPFLIPSSYPSLFLLVLIFQSSPSQYSSVRHSSSIFYTSLHPLTAIQVFRCRQ